MPHADRGLRAERRRDPLTGEWRTFAAHRQDRTFLPAADDCPLCPTRDPGRPTELDRPAFDIAVFDNRFPALLADPPEPALVGTGPYRTAPAVGAAEVVVYTDRHDRTLTDLPPPHLTRLVDVWADRYAVLGARPEVAYVFVFENRGQAVGVTLDHPHGQVYAYPEIPPLPRRELDEALAHRSAHGTCVYCDVVAQEQADAARLVAGNQSFLAFVPFAARMPYEVHLAARRHATSLLDLTGPERAALAGLLREVVLAYDSLFGFPLPYVMSMHQAPTDEARWLPVSHLHLEFTPVHRTATKLKYLAGSELGAGAFIGDRLPEDTAADLRAAGARAAVAHGPAPAAGPAGVANASTGR
ncbi:MAG TPA: galactose-1-phosphate uridylyltransferase [Pilimelia sp.]|nr:galactose-1-phosphate uridylyltransferase [Pilimelia sp.]